MLKSRKGACTLAVMRPHAVAPLAMAVKATGRAVVFRLGTAGAEREALLIALGVAATLR